MRSQATRGLCLALPTRLRGCGPTRQNPQPLQAIPIVSGEVFGFGTGKKRADGYIEKKRKINGKVVHFYGKTAREVQRKIDEALENAAKAKEESEVLTLLQNNGGKII